MEECRGLFMEAMILIAKLLDDPLLVNTRSMGDKPYHTVWSRCVAVAWDISSTWGDSSQGNEHTLFVTLVQRLLGGINHALKSRASKERRETFDLHLEE